MHDIVRFFRSNPQALALLVVCVILGLGTFLVVMLGLISANSSSTTGEPSGLVLSVQALLS